MIPNRWRDRILLTAAAVLAVLILFGFFGRVRARAQMAKVKTLQQELSTPAARQLPADQRRAKFDELRQASAKLTDEQRRGLAADMRKRRLGELKHYAALSRADQIHQLDELINRAEAARRNGGPGGPGGFGGFGGPGRPPNVGGPGGAGGPGGSPLSAEDREKRRKERLDHTTPEERALFDRFRHDLAARRTQRGLPPGGPGPRG
jgi:hypothetical protein